MNNHFDRKVQGNEKKRQKMKNTDRTLTKTERNRLCMEIYQQERCSEKQKQKIREYDRKGQQKPDLKRKWNKKV